MWQNNAPAPGQVVDSLYYSTNVFAARAIEKISARSTAAPLYIHLTWQNVHGPYSPPPDWETLKSAEYLQNYCEPTSPSIYPHDARCNFGGSLKAVDDGMKNITDALKQKGRWEELLLLVTSDNGGIGPSNNHPLRGSKLTPW
jgi:arylsulfatase A-like enzyme